ncbi:MAG: nucleoside triphosphate pyrophosphohydrolase [Lentisphaerae bacterium]|nr:nucleoside triphosphate pyrophosphohydrolase [Lentisphaerota bacterium]
MSTVYPPEADSLMAILRRLRAPDGCPWDREQTRKSLVRHLDGECAELIYAIDREDVPNICEELGDLLMNLFFQVIIAEENGEFTLADVWRGIIDKMIRRHDHIFGNSRADSAEEVAALWQKIKAAEHSKSPESKSVMDDVKLSLSVLDRAEKLQKAAAKTGFDWESAGGVLDKITEETAEVREAMISGNDEHIDEELGDLLFAVVNLIRFRGKSHAAELLRRANLKFEDRFRAMEAKLAADGKVPDKTSPEEMNEYWDAVKADEARKKIGEK